jgi:hypothetical protein
MGFKSPSAMRHPKGLWLTELWWGQNFKENITKLKENVKPVNA